MILATILGQLDGELARLQQLRAIVAGLGTPLAVTLALPEPALSPDPKPEQPFRRRGRLSKSAADGPVRRTPKPRTSEARALTNAIPAGPVVVSAAALRQKEAQRSLLTGATSATPALDPDPEGLLRELSQRWGTGASAHPA